MELIKAHLIIACILYAFATLFSFAVLFRTNLKIHWGKFKIIVLLGFAAQTISLMLYWQIKKHFPVTSNTEAFFLMGWLLIPLMLFIAYRTKDVMMNSILLPFIIISILVMLLKETPLLIINPKLISSWMYLHIPSSLLGIIFLFTTFGTSLMYLLQEDAVKHKKSGWIYYKLPSMQRCDRISYYCLVTGFILITIGLISGIFWAKAAFGKFWQWDIKEILTAFTWIAYAVLLFNRIVMKWHGKPAAYFALIAFLLVLIMFFGFQFITHSYHTF